MEQVLTSIYFVLHALLNVSFADPPYIEMADGTVGSNRFLWELDDWHIKFEGTTQEIQENRVADAWGRIGVFSDSRRRRLLAGLHYFHRARRLARVGATAGEFVGEQILNLAKSLQVLFPHPGDKKTIDAARRGLHKRKVSKAEIECNFIPAIALRNTIDVGHEQLGLFKTEQLRLIHGFTERAEQAFHKMFEQIFAQLESGEFEIDSYELGPPSKEALKVIERLKTCVDKQA